MESFMSVDRGGLRGAVSLVSKAAPKHRNWPALSHLKLSANGKLTLAATDLENRIEVDVEKRSGEQSFELLMPADAMRRWARSKGSETVDLASDGLSLVIDGAIRIPGMETVDFPTDAEEIWERIGEVDAQALGEALDRTRFALSKDATRFTLTGILLEIRKKGRSHAVASDGTRLVVHAFDVHGIERPLREVLNPEGAGLLAAACRKVPEGTSVVIEAARAPADSRIKIRFAALGLRVWTLSLAGTFPEWRQVVPTDDSYDHAGFRIPASGLREALAKMAPCFDTEFHRALFAFSGHKLVISAKSQANGAATVEIDCEGEGERSIHLDAKKVLDYLASLSQSANLLRVRIPEKPSATKWTCESGSDIHVLMPLAS